MKLFFHLKLHERTVHVVAPWRPIRVLRQSLIEFGICFKRPRFKRPLVTVFVHSALSCTESLGHRWQNSKPTRINGTSYCCTQALNMALNGQRQNSSCGSNQGGIFITNWPGSEIPRGWETDGKKPNRRIPPLVWVYSIRNAQKSDHFSLEERWDGWINEVKE